MTGIVLSNGVSIELLGDGETFAGLGEVQIGGSIMRSGERPMFADIRTPDGVQMGNFRLTSFVNTQDSAKLIFDMDALAGGPMDWMLHEVRPRVNTVDWTRKFEAAADTKLILHLKPVTRVFGEQIFKGFSYEYSYSSDKHPIYKITDRGTWEVGGAAEGNEFWLRNSFAPSIYPIASCTQAYSTEWYLGSAMNSSVFQFLPWQTNLEGFSMTCHESGVLVTWASKAAHIRSLFEKRTGNNLIAHWHEHCGDLTSRFDTVPVEVLFSPGSGNRVDRLNQYHSVREAVAQELHDQVGFTRERVQTYAVIEEWGRAELVKYREVGLPQVLAAGVKKIYLANHFQNNMNVYGVGNMCCTIDYHVADSVGEQNLTDFCSAANKGGAEVEMWGNTALSTFGLTAFAADQPSEVLCPLSKAGSVMEMLASAADPFVRNPAGHMEADHYAPVFAQLNLLDRDVREYWLTHWKYAREQIGLNGIFLDSSFNLSSDKFHWVANPTAVRGAGGTADQTDLLGGSRPERETKPAIYSQYFAHLQLMAAMQKMGYSYCGEDVGVFGVHRASPPPGEQLTSLALWTDCLGEFDGSRLERDGQDPDSIFFKGLAYRMVWRLHWTVDKDELSWRQGGIRDHWDAPYQWQLDLLKIYNVVEGDMRDRTILKDEKGVVYRNGSKSVLWAFEDLSFPLPEGASVIELTRGTGLERNGSRLEALASHVYVIETQREAI